MIGYLCADMVCERYQVGTLLPPLVNGCSHLPLKAGVVFTKMVKYNDITGIRFGRLIALEYVGKSRWRCECDCGAEHIAAYTALRSGRTLSCGCYHREVCSGRPAYNRTHNMKDTPEFNIWSMMKNRCTNPNCNRHKFYKDKGIKVCDRWLGPNGFQNFIADMGLRPGPTYSIDRINNDGDYTPDNCRWATRKEQLNNQSRNLVLLYKGRQQTLALWCDELGLNYKRTWKRLKSGWDVSRAFEEPLDERWRNRRACNQYNT